MTSPIGGPLGDSAESRLNEFGAELGEELDAASRHVRRGFERAGAAMDDGAEKVKDGIRHTKEGVRNATKRVTGAVGSSTRYVRSTGMRDVLDDVEGIVKEHPGKSLLAMAAIGFLVGRSLSSRE